ncbi:MAG: hypothetical protein ABI460_11545, partial [Caldimonas sp.]
TGYQLPENKPTGPDLKLPADPKKQIDLLTEAIGKVQDAVKRDKLVVALRDAVVKIQPVMSDKDARKALDKAIDSLVETGSKKLLMALLEAATGRKATEVKDGDRTQTGPPMKEKDLDEHIFTIPLPLPFDKPPPVRRGSFEFRDLPRKARVGSYVAFTLRTRDGFESFSGDVVVMEAGDFKKNGQQADRLKQSHIEDKGDVKMSVAMPDEPGQYVVGIFIRSVLESYPTENIEVTK